MSQDPTHPEASCDRCGHRMRFNYSAVSETWNQVVGYRWSIICIDCFIELCQAAGVEPNFEAFHIPGSKFHLVLNDIYSDPVLINPDSHFECLFCKTRFRIGDGHHCPGSKKIINDIQAGIDSLYFGSQSHKIYLQGLLEKFKKQ